MTALYWFAMVVGVGMYLFSVFADVTGDAEVTGDADVNFDGDLHTGDVHHGADGYQILSLRNVTYFLFAFGVTGVALQWLWGGARGLLTGILAVMLGALGAAMSTFAFGWLRRSESGEMPGDQSWIGAPAEVVLPLSIEGTGKVYAERAGRRQELLARPFDAVAEHPERWTNVLILDIKDGIALVAPNELSLDDPATSDRDMPRRDAPHPGASHSGASRRDASTEN